jgi:hypothetical protein
MNNRWMAIVAVSLVLPTGAAAVNYKKDYCGNQEYVGNTGKKYAHLHCGKSFFTLSKTKSNHTNFNGNGNCNKVDEVLNDKEGFYGTAANMTAITNALDAYKNAGCP